MAQVELWVGEAIQAGPAEAIGFFGPDGFGDPISVGQFNGRTFLTNASGTMEGVECDNCRYLDSDSVIVGQTGSGIGLQCLPNYLATANLRFVHATPCLVNNVKLYINDGIAKTANPSGLTFHAAEIRHAGLKQDNTGIGDALWNVVGGPNTLGLVDSPGTSGLRPFGSNTTDTRHDWYVAMTCTPTTPGDKQFGMTVELEYLGD